MQSLQLWLSNGYTTAAELGLGLSGDDVDMVKTIIDQKLLPIGAQHVHLRCDTHSARHDGHNCG